MSDLDEVARELDALVGEKPLKQPLVLRGETLNIKPINTGRLPAFLRAIRPLVDLFNLDALALSGDLTDPAHAQQAALLMLDQVMPAFLAEPDAVVQAVAVATGKPQAWLDELELDELLILAGACIEVNADFFARRLMPALLQMVKGMTPPPTAGSTSPSASSPTATATGT